MKLTKYPKIRRLGHDKTKGILESGEELILLEKLDGQNFRLKLDEESDMILYGSRNTLFKEYDAPQHYEDIGGTFQKGARYIENNIDKEKLKELNEEYGEVQIFGENMVKHTLDYEWDEIPQFLGFDIWTEEEGWLEYDKMCVLMTELGLEVAPIFDSMDAGEFDHKDYEIPESQFRDGKAEGVVIRRSSDTDKQGSWRGSRAKYLSEEFEEKHKSAKSGAEPMTDDEELVETYATDGRIRKHINKLTVDEGKDLEMSLMDELPMRIVEDIWQEEHQELVRTNKKIDMKQFRSLVASKCVPILKKKIRYNAGDS